MQDKKEKDSDGAGKRRKTSQSEEVRFIVACVRTDGLNYPFQFEGLYVCLMCQFVCLCEFMCTIYVQLPGEARGHQIPWN